MTVITVIILISIIVVDDTVAFLATGVVIFKAAVAETGAFIAVYIVVPDNFFTAVTDCCVAVNAVLTDWLAVDCVVVIVLDDFTAVRVVNFFFHFEFLHKIKIALSEFEPRGLCCVD